MASLLQSASDIARNLFARIQQQAQPAVQNTGRFLAQDFQHSQPVQAYHTLQNIAANPQVQQVGRQIVQNPIVQQVAKQPIISQPAFTQFLPSKPIIGPTVGQYTQAHFIQPAQTLLSKTAPLLDKASSGAQLGFNTLAPTASTVSNFAIGGAAGLLKTIRQGGNLNQNISKSIANPSDIAGTGLGIKNPIAATAVDLFTANPKALLGNTKQIVQALKGYSPNGFSIHPADQEIMGNFINEVQNLGGKSAKLDPGLLKDAQNIAEHYIGKAARTVSNEKLAQAFDALLSSAARKRGEDALQTAFPKMGFTAKQDENLAPKSELQTPPQQAIPTMSSLSEKPGLGLPQVSNLEKEQLNTSTQTLAQEKTPGQVPVDTQKYLTELAGKQKAAGSSGPSTLVQKGKGFLSNLKTQLVDSTSPIEDAVNLAEKQGKFKIQPTSDIRLQIDRVLRSKSLASQFAEDNGLVNVIKQAPDLHALDQYMIAKQAAKVGENGIQTGRDVGKDAKLVQDLAPTYEPLAKQVNKYSQNLLDYSVKSGLISKDLATGLKQKYPDYVPLNRIFNELEQNGYQGATKSIANLSQQTVVQKLKGSTREIQSPIESLLLKTQTAFQQGEKNQAAKMLAGYQNLPGLKDIIKPIASTSESPHTFTYLDNGVKKAFATTPEIASAAKSLNAQQMNIVTKILSYPTRALQLGATGLNVPFAATNLLKDQVDTFINSNKATRTSMMNPVNFLHALFAATSHNELYKDAIRNAAISTSFDISREAPNLSINKIRAGRTVAGKIAYTATHPAELLRDLENAIGRTEELTRVQNFRGQYKALLAQGRTPADARLLAAQGARSATANFARSGDLGKVINYVIPFFNASIQGSRSFVNAAKNQPIQTGAKLTAGLFLPMAASTLYNLTDPARKQVYDDIPQSDKERNIIIIPDGAAKDKNGKYNVIKIPLPSGLAPITNLVRRGIEQTQGGNPVAAKEVFDALVGSTTPLDTSSPTKLVGGLTPQAIKPAIEGITNTNLYTGNKIVPDSMKNLPPNQQVKPGTSPIASAIGKATGISPLVVENTANTALGGVGGQILGKNPAQQLQARFTQANSGDQQNKQFTDIQKYQSADAQISAKKKVVLTKVATMLQDPNVDRSTKIQLVTAISKDKTLFGQLKQEISDQQQGVTPADRAIRSLSTTEKAKYIKDQLQPLSREQKRALAIQYIKKGILTKEVVKEMTQPSTP